MKRWAVDRAEWEGWSTPVKDGKPKPTNEKVTKQKSTNHYMHEVRFKVSFLQ